MARIAGIDIPKDKKVAYSLRYIHGIGLTTALKICELSKINPDSRVTDLSSKEEDSIRKAIVDLKLLIEGELRTENIKNIKRLQDIGSYRGVRHRKSLPVRGQRTKTNSRTKRGRKQTVGLGKKVAEIK
jgi:small subunit ribosomal protein S13